MGYITNFTLENAQNITENNTKTNEILEAFKKHLEDLNKKFVDKISLPFTKIENKKLKEIKLAMKNGDLDCVLALNKELEISKANLELSLKQNKGCLRDIDIELEFVQELLTGWEVTGKWYCYDSIMVELSKVINNIPLELHGNGEEEHDKWIKIWKNGELISYKLAKITIEYVETLEK